MGAAIEAPLTFFEEPVEVLRFDAVEFAKMPFGLVPEVLDPIDVVVSISEELRVVDSHVVKITDIKGIVGLESVGVNDAIGNHFLLDDRQDSLGFGVRDDGRVNLPTPLQEPEDRDLASCPSATLALANASEVAFIRFDLSSQFVAG